MKEPRSMRAFVAVLLTCLVAGLSYAGAVTTTALSAFVLPSVAIAYVVGAVLTRRRSPVSGVIVGGVVALGLAELVNVVSQNSNGPAARSTAVAAGCAALAGVAVTSRWPASFFLAVGGIVAGAMSLGAGGEVDLVAVVTAVLAIASLNMVELERRNWSQRPRRRMLVGLIALLAAAAAAGVVLVQAQFDRRQPELLARGAVHLGIKPAITDPLTAAAQRQAEHEPDRRHPAGQARRARLRRLAAHQSGSRHARRHHARLKRDHHRSRSSAADAFVLAAIVIGALLLLALLLLLTRFLIVWLKWRRLRRHFSSGETSERIAGAWSWAQRWLAACRMALPPPLSPDLIPGSTALDDLPPSVTEPLVALARQVSEVAFALPTVMHPDAAVTAWATADDVVSTAYDTLTRRRRALLMMRTPPSGPIVRADSAGVIARLGSTR